MNTLYTGASAAVYAVITAAVLFIAGDVVKPHPVRMQVEYLRYEDGHFYQKLSIDGAKTIVADWSSRIWRDANGTDTMLCDGGGRFPYTGTHSEPMSPSYWTDDECPDLQPGDKALAVWEYVDEEGVRRRISAQIDIE